MMVVAKIEHEKAGIDENELYTTQRALFRRPLTSAGPYKLRANLTLYLY
jgi:hypothetical protein